MAVRKVVAILLLMVFCVCGLLVTFQSKLNMSKFSAVRSIVGYKVNLTGLRAMELAERPRLGTRTVCSYPPSRFKGAVRVDLSDVKMETLEAQHTEVKAGGRWRPDTCTPPSTVAIMIPFRDRDQHLRIFLRHMHPFLQKQLISYTIYVIEQTNGTKFNRGFLFNVGFTEAMKEDNYDCFIFHDVDLLPENDKNLYSCLDHPVLMSTANSKFVYRLPYKGYFGGVTAVSRLHYLQANGYSNNFYGWGAEDDDMYYRLKRAWTNPSNISEDVGRYRAIDHKQAEANPKRFIILEKNRNMRTREGLDTTEYRLLKFEKKSLFTWLLTQPIYTESEDVKTDDNIDNHGS